MAPKPKATAAAIRVRTSSISACSRLTWGPGRRLPGRGPADGHQAEDAQEGHQDDHAQAHPARELRLILHGILLILASDVSSRRLAVTG
ncbi:MAG: hypothetical protein M0C28_43505 [Candidatus Moduliflexus flocculans]|nr:hypothetical protein [Candidatus Moduliflexus flocculans]